MVVQVKNRVETLKQRNKSSEGGGRNKRWYSRGEEESRGELRGFREEEKERREWREKRRRGENVGAVRT